MPLLFSLLSDASVLKHDFRDINNWSWAFGSLMLSAVAAVGTILFLHMRWARQADQLVGYLVPRCAILGYCGTAIFLLSQAGHSIHLHHLYLGLGLAMWADANHPLSAGLLAAGTGIFCQGIAAYSYAPVALPVGCFDTPSAGALACDFRADAAFALRVCTAAGEGVEHTCHAA